MNQQKTSQSDVRNQFRTVNWPCEGCDLRYQADKHPMDSRAQGEGESSRGEEGALDARVWVV